MLLLCALLAAGVAFPAVRALCTPNYNVAVTCPDLGSCGIFCTEPTPGPRSYQATYVCRNQLSGEPVEVAIRNPNGVNVQAVLTSDGCSGTSYNLPTGYNYGDLRGYDFLNPTQSATARLYSPNPASTACLVLRCWVTTLFGSAPSSLIYDAAFGGTLSNPNPIGLRACTAGLSGPSASGVGGVSVSRVAACVNPRATTTMATRSGLVPGSAVAATVYNLNGFSIRVSLQAGSTEVTAFESGDSSRALSGTCNADACSLVIRCNADIACVGLSFDLSVVPQSASNTPSRPPSPSGTGPPSSTQSSSNTPSEGSTPSNTMTPSAPPSPGLDAPKPSGPSLTVAGFTLAGATFYAAVGGAAGAFILVVLLVYCCCCRRRRGAGLVKVPAHAGSHGDGGSLYGTPPPHQGGGGGGGFMASDSSGYVAGGFGSALPQYAVPGYAVAPAWGQQAGNPQQAGGVNPVRGALTLRT